jgi:2-oxoisovalerate dehydrogenase E1 component
MRLDGGGLVAGSDGSAVLDDWQEMLRRMRRIREFESHAARLYREGQIPGFVHLALGQEATAVGACWPLRADDVITSNHRGHGHCLAKGMQPVRMFAELLARQDGYNRGRGGSMHIADPSIGVLGANGIVAGGLPIAGGAAFAAQLRGSGQVAIAFFGDGAVAQGAFHETANLASEWHLPLVLFCENNGYSEFTPTGGAGAIPLSDRAVGYHIGYEWVDGNDVVAVAGLMTVVLDRLRSGTGPVLVEAITYRWHGHYEGDPQRYRSEDEVEQWRGERDPIALLERRLVDARIDPAKIQAVADDVAAEIEAAEQAAKALPEPHPSTLHDYVLVTRRSKPEHAALGTGVYRVMDAIREALADEMTADSSVFLAGVDVGKAGNVFGLTRGLYERWPDRVLDTPISESAIVGLGIGAAMVGLKPVIEVMYLDFLGVCFDQILNQAAKMHFMTGGAATAGLTLRTQFGAGRSSGSQHSQSLEAILAHIPGLSVVMPSNPADTYALLRASIQDPNPVIFIENRLLYGFKGPRPIDGHTIPVGKACVAHEGSDVTLVSISRMVHECLAAASELGEEGISVEVIDLRTLVPLDVETILTSLAKTSRLVIAHEAVGTFGFGAEIAALAANEGFCYLDAPIRRITAASTPPPYSPALERVWLPDRARIAQEIRTLVAW